MGLAQDGSQAERGWLACVHADGFVWRVCIALARLCQANDWLSALWAEARGGMQPGPMRCTTRARLARNGPLSQAKEGILHPLNQAQLPVQASKQQNDVSREPGCARSTQPITLRVLLGPPCRLQLAVRYRARSELLYIRTWQNGNHT